MIFEWNWLRGRLDDHVEAETFAALRILLNGNAATRVYDHVAGGERDAVRVPLYPIARGISENWWQLLYEPKKSDQDINEPLHALDAYLKGYIFPFVTVWSGGDQAVLLETSRSLPAPSNLEFLHASDSTYILQRSEVEADLFTIVDATLQRLSPSEESGELRASWERVLSSIQDSDELKYCIAAGRLGLDPYDEDGPDLADLASGLPEDLFSDVCDAASPEEIAAAVAWAHAGSRMLGEAPAVDVSDFGQLPARHPGNTGAQHGYEAARAARSNLGLDNQNPRRVVDRIFGAAVRADAPVVEGVPSPLVEGIVRRTDGIMHTVLPKGSARFRRSALCRSAYLAWQGNRESSAAVTTASTVSQQASRAFAAEILVPSEWLRERAGSTGLTYQDVNAIAGDLACPEPTVIWQAYNHNIPLRGIALPANMRQGCRS